MVCIEPTSYIQGLVAEIATNWWAGVDVVYTGKDISQAWSLPLNAEHERVLPRGTLRALLEIRRLVTHRRYALIEIAGWSHPVMLATLVLARWWRLPAVVHTDTPRPPRTDAWKRLVKRLAFPMLFELPAMFLPAGSLQAAYLGDYGVAPSRTRIVGMTVDVKAIGGFVSAGGYELRLDTRHKHDTPDEAVLFLYVGRLVEHKGIDDLLRAFALLRKVDRSVELMIVGNGPLDERVQSAAGRGTGVHFAGRLSGEALWAAYGAGDVLVLPSHFEPWGLVVNEAMAAGLPVIASDRVGCVGDLVRDGETGMVFPAGSVVTLADAMLRMTDGDLRQAMKAACARLIADWTLQRQAAKTMAAWNEVLAA